VRKVTHAQKRYAWADCDGVGVHDVITSANFYDCRLCHVWAWWGVKFWVSTLTRVVALTTLSHYRASVWSLLWPAFCLLRVCGYWTTKRHARYQSPSSVALQCETDQARSRTIHNHGRLWIVCMTARLDVTLKTTEQNRIVCTSKLEAEVTNNKKTALEVLLLYYY